MPKESTLPPQKHHQHPAWRQALLWAGASGSQAGALYSPRDATEESEGRTDPRQCSRIWHSRLGLALSVPSEPLREPRAYSSTHSITLEPEDVTAETFLFPHIQRRWPFNSWRTLRVCPSQDRVATALLGALSRLASFQPI